MTKLTIVAQIQAKPEKVDLVKTELEKLVSPTRSEKGCLQYDLHQDNETPELFLFFENWESRDLWQAHMKSEHIQAYQAATEGAVDRFVLNEMTHII
ncbi:MAG: putative quinol monooxygenase [Verrucomicrobiota bacterium]